MKNSKTLSLFIAGLLAAYTSQAQEVKAEPGKQLEKNTTVDNRPSPQPALNPQPGPTPAASVTNEKTAQPAQEETKRPVPQANLQVLTIDPDAANKKLTAENLRTLNGKGDKPRQVEPTPAVKTEGKQ
jgi:hypothetical protein